MPRLNDNVFIVKVDGGVLGYGNTFTKSMFMAEKQGHVFSLEEAITICENSKSDIHELSKEDVTAIDFEDALEEGYIDGNGNPVMDCTE